MTPPIILLNRHAVYRSEEHTSELQSLRHLVCRLLLEKKKNANTDTGNSTNIMLNATRTRWRLQPLHHISVHVCKTVLAVRAQADPILLLFFFNDTATTEIYTLSLHDALPI